MKLPEDAVESSLKVLDISVVNQRGDELIALCPGHLGRTGHVDHKPDWSINTDTGQHNCFSCGYKGNLYTLYLDLRGREAANAVWQGMTSLGVPLPEGYRVNRDLAMPTLEEEPPKYQPEAQLAVFSYPPDWAIEARRLDRSAVNFYGVKWAKDRAAWVLPFRDPRTEDLLGYQLKGQLEKIVRNKPTGLQKKHTFFGYLEARHSDRVVVVESPLDAVLLHRLGHAAVAVCGSRLSEEQLGLLQNFDFVQIAMDNDPVGRTEAERISRMMPGFPYQVIKYKTDKKDFGEMDDDEIERTLSGV